MNYDDETFKITNNIILGITGRSMHKFKGLSKDDISQQLWFKVISEENKRGKHLSPELIATICYREIINIQRYEMRRNHYSLNSIDIIEDSAVDGHETIKIDEILNLFPEDSKERTIVEYWCASFGIIYDKKYINPNKNSYKNGFTENYLAQILGFGNSTHRGYKSLREKVRNKIKEYFENNLNLD